MTKLIIKPKPIPIREMHFDYRKIISKNHSSKNHTRDIIEQYEK